MAETLLDVQQLTKYFPVRRTALFGERRRVLKAVDEISFTIQCGETVGLVGESGSGKSTTARLLVRLLDPTAGAIYFAGQDIVKLDEATFRPLRRHMQMVFQDPFSSLKPRIDTAAKLWRSLTTARAWAGASGRGSSACSTSFSSSAWKRNI